MSELIEHVQHLAQDIGPRPAGTEEERVAAEYIQEQIELNSGLDVKIEDFLAPLDAELPRLVFSILAVIAGVVGLLVPMLRIVAVIVLLIVSALMLVDYFGMPLLSKTLPKGACQNVVAKYVPETQVRRGRRSRKVVIVAHYDSGKVRAELNSPLKNSMRIINLVTFFAVPVLFLLMLVRATLLGSDTGAASSVFSLLIVIATVLSAIPAVIVILHKAAKYNDAANANASGTAMLIELANRVSEGRLPESANHNFEIRDEQEVVDELINYPEAEPAVIHGEEAARAILPEDVDLSYETTANKAEDFAAENDLGGQTLAMEPIDIESAPEVQVEEREKEIVDEAQVAQIKQPEPESSVPSWYLAAQKKAKRSEEPKETKPFRSKYTLAMDAAEEARAAEVEAQSALSVLPAAESIAAAAQEHEAAEQKRPVEPEPAPIEREEQRSVKGETSKEHDAKKDERKPRQIESEIEAFDEPAPELPESLLDLVEKSEIKEAEQNIAPRGSEPKKDSRAQKEKTEQEQETKLDKSQEGPEPKEGQKPKPERVLVNAEEPEEEPEEEPAGVDDFVGGVTSQMNASSDAAEDLSLSKKLPKISASMTGSMTAVGNTAQQRAPLADEDAKETAKNLLNMLPTIDLNNPNEEQMEEKIPEISPLKSAALPKVTQKTSNEIGVAGATGMFAPVTDEMVQNAESEEELFLDDVEEIDESGFQENFTDSGAYAGPDYIEMPKSRVRGFFGRMFGRNKDNEIRYEEQVWYSEEIDEKLAPEGNQDYPVDGQEYVEGTDVYYEDVYEEPYDESYDRPYDEPSEDYKDYDGVVDETKENDQYKKGSKKYNGGAFSALKDRATSLGDAARNRAKSPNGQSRGNVEGEYADNFDEQMDGDYSEEQPRRDRRSNRRGDEGDTSTRRRRFSDGLPLEPLPLDTVLPPEAEEVEAFEAPFINTEVWFVALGGELAGNAGTNALIETHKDELRGAMIIELDGLGAGKLSSVTEEGALKPVKFSSRAKRLIRKATQATGIQCASVAYPWCDSAAACASKFGLPAMHLVGDQDGKPAFFAEPSDVDEVVDEEILNNNTEFVMELIHAVSQ